MMSPIKYAQDALDLVDVQLPSHLLFQAIQWTVIESADAKWALSVTLLPSFSFLSLSWLGKKVWKIRLHLISTLKLSEKVQVQLSIIKKVYISSLQVCRKLKGECVHFLLWIRENTRDKLLKNMPFVYWRISLYFNNNCSKFLIDDYIFCVNININITIGNFHKTRLIIAQKRKLWRNYCSCLVRGFITPLHRNHYSVL